MSSAITKVALLSTVPRITPAFLARCALAYAAQAAALVADWREVYPELVAPDVRVVTSVAQIQHDDCPILYTPTIDQPGDLAYHYENLDRPYGVVLADDGQAFPSVEQAGGHEVNEAIIDPMCGLFDADGFAVEVHDPLQDDALPWPVPGGDPVLLSPYALPAWFNFGHPVVAGARFDSAGLLTSVHQIRPSGYAQREQDGKMTEVYGERFEAHPPRKLGRHARRNKRSRRLAAVLAIIDR